MPIVSGYRPPGAHHAPKSSRKELILSAPPTPPAGAPSSAPSPGSAAASPPLRIDTEESWNRANAWLGSKDSATSPVASEVKRLLNLAFSRWEQPGAAAPLVVEACRLAGLDPVPGDEIVARPAPTPPTPWWRGALDPGGDASEVDRGVVHGRPCSSSLTLGRRPPSSPGRRRSRRALGPDRRCGRPRRAGRGRRRTR